LRSQELLDWYFAYLRKDSQSRDASNFTPMALVKADQEIIKQRIANEQERADEQSLQAVQRSTDASPSSRLAKFVRLPRKSLLLVCVIICALQMFVAVFSPALTFLLPISSLLCLVLLSLILNDEHASEQRLSFAIKDTQPENPSLSKRFDMNKSVNALIRQNELLKQKEILTFDYCPYLLCELDESFRVKSVNFKASSLWGISQQQLSGVNIMDLLSEQSREVLSESLQRSRRFSNADSANIISMAKGDCVDLLWRSEWSETAKSYFCLAEDISLRMENERIKAEMSTMITHDLKAPISALVFWIDNMLSGCYGDLHEDAVYSLKRTDRNLRSVLALLDNLMDVEKLESSLVPCNKQKLKLIDSFDRVSETLADWLLDAKLELECQETELEVFADQDQIDRILINYCSNAIKVSPAGASIILRAKTEGKYAVIEVIDQGPGIPANLKGSLFQRWVSPSAPNTKLSAGSGIGLYAARKFAELQGGSVGASEGVNGGTILWFSLPLAD
jgi:signal transduction histidine kinase